MGMGKKGTFVAVGAQVAPNLTITNPNNSDGLNLTKSGTGTGDACKINNAGTGKALSVVQTGDAITTYIKNSGTKETLQANSDTATRAANTPCIKIYDDQHTTDSNEWSATILVQGGNHAEQTAPLISTYNYAASPQRAINIDHAGNGHPIYITNAGTSADIHLSPRASAGMAAGTEGDLYYDSTTHKLMIRTAAGYETITSS